MKYVYILVLLVLTTSCFKTLQKGFEEEVKEEATTVLEEDFDKYADAWHEKKRLEYRDKVTWVLGAVGGTLGVIATSGGLILLYRKLKKKDEDV